MEWGGGGASSVWTEGRGFDTSSGPPLFTGWVGVSRMWQVETKVMVSPLPTGWVGVRRMWQVETKVVVFPLFLYVAAR